MQRFESEAYRAVIDHGKDVRHCHLPAKLVQQMRKQAEAGYPHEICGLLVGAVREQVWWVSEVRAVANLNTDRADDRFELDPQAYQRIDRELRGTGKEIIGVYHSHPDCLAQPSPTDLAHAWDMLLYPIISVHQGKADQVVCWALNAEGKRFIRIDCADVQ